MPGNERIDHAAEAARVLRDVSADSNGTYADAMAYAQIHATLALVEQQRIANLIAYFSINDAFGGGPGSSGAMEDIERGLGLVR